MIKTFQQFFKTHHIDEQAGFIVAVSGGADSITLLHILKYLNLNIYALHCNFNLRGKESNMDEQFVKRFCHTYGIALTVKSFDTRGYAEKKGISIEMAARDLRYEWFEKMRQTKKMDYIVLGHHADDLAETLFINICRGTGIRGLTGIQPVNGKLLRPLLPFSRKDIIEYIDKNQLGFRTDSTNLSLDYVRNKIRHQIIPVCKDINPSFLKTVQETCDVMYETNKIYQYGIERLKEEILTHRDGEILIDIEKVMASPSPYTLLFETLKPYGFNAAQTDSILKSHDAIPGRHFQAEEYLLTKGRTYWQLFNILEKEDIYGLLADSGVYNWGEVSFRLEEIPVDENFTLSDNPSIGYFDADKITYPLIVRHWSIGDWFCPLGMKRSKKKLSDLFIDLKFSAKQKKDTLILQSGKEIIWIAGIRIDDRYKISHSTRNALVISYNVQKEVSS